MCGKFTFCLLLAVAGAVLSATGAQPNLVVLIADGIGPSDLSCYNGSQPTPHLDGLAAQGTRFNRFMAASGICSPSRASLLTGVYPLRHRITDDLRAASAHLPTNSVTLPELLKPAGYTSVHVGKWDLGGMHRENLGNRTTSPGPREHGFDHYFARLENESRAVFAQNDEVLPEAPATNGRVEIGEAIRWLGTLATNSAPFLLQVGFDTDRAESHKNRVQAIDAGTGEILQKLEALGIRSSTLILFTSDAGPAEMPKGFWLKGSRGGLDNGALRVPFLISWPGIIKAGRTVEVPMHGNDVVPTLLAASGIKLPETTTLDGLDFLPFLRGQRAAPTATLFWSQRSQGKTQDVILKNRWKLFSEGGRPTALYNVFLDDGEQNDVLSRYSTNAVPTLVNDLQQWLEQVKH